MATTNQKLLHATDQLEKALAHAWQGPQEAWLTPLAGALRHVEEALYSLPAITEGKFLQPVEKPAEQRSPGLIREVRDLRHVHMELLRQARSLFVQTQIPGLADQGVLRQQCEALHLALREFSREDDKLVQETVNRDTGAGD